MSERSKIEERLSKKKLEIQFLEEKIRATRVYVQALQDVLKLLEHDSEPSQPAESILRSGSAVDRARDVILKRRQPVHINELLEEMGKEPTRDSRASLTSSLAAYVRRGEIFTRPAPNTFGLVELGHSSVEDEATEPPSGFGKLYPPSSPSPPPPRSPTRPSIEDDVPF